MLAVTKALREDKDFSELLSRIEYGGCPLVYSGLGAVHMAAAAAAVRRETGRTVILICSDELLAERMRGDVAALTQEEALLLTSREFTFFSADTVSRRGEQARLQVLHSLSSDSCAVLIATPDALMQRTLPPKRLSECTFTLKQGASLSIQ
ncbi:MAG: transcription-repair coupling factor, partial [Oscillospiraceae bacterium]|nr:transcription-repair coupling factor [Oscillospiraceae bacterium]